jgi:hypothetical protein
MQPAGAIVYGRTNSLKGGAIASSAILDGNFNRTVVLVVDYDRGLSVCVESSVAE